MSRVAVVGPGSVGTFFAAHLAAAGNDVVACARRPFREYVVDSPESPVRAPAHVVTDPDELAGPADWVLVTVKAHHTDGAAPWLHQLCRASTKVVVIQNGVEGAERVAPHAGDAEVVPAVVYCGAELLEPGHIAHRQDGTLILPDIPTGHQVVELFVGTPAVVRATDRYLTDAWRKLGLNVMFNGITALTMRPISVVSRPGVADVARQLLHETWAVARAEGADLSVEAVDELVDGFQQFRDAGPTSMLQDRRAGRPTEHDALYGAVVRAGRRHGIPTPLCAVFDALLAAGDPEAGPTAGRADP
jgi:2-dehydropantoate 2-reductase